MVATTTASHHKEKDKSEKNCDVGEASNSGKDGGNTDNYLLHFQYNDLLVKSQFTTTNHALLEITTKLKIIKEIFLKFCESLRILALLKLPVVYPPVPRF